MTLVSLRHSRRSWRSLTTSLRGLPGNSHLPRKMCTECIYEFHLHPSVLNHCRPSTRCKTSKHTSKCLKESNPTTNVGAVSESKQCIALFEGRLDSDYFRWSPVTRISPYLCLRMMHCRSQPQAQTEAKLWSYQTLGQRASTSVSYILRLIICPVIVCL